MERDDHYEQLAMLIHDKELDYEYIRKQYKEHPSDHIRKYFKAHPDKLAEAENLYKKKQETEHYNRESWKKHYIMQRVSAYDYEEMLYQIYAPTAEETIRGWYSREISESEMINRISEIKNISRFEAFEMLNLLKEKQILFRTNRDNEVYYSLSFMLEKEIGGVGARWDIVSDTDWNLDKWMVAHGYEHKQ